MTSILKESSLLSVGPRLHPSLCSSEPSLSSDPSTRSRHLALLPWLDAAPAVVASVLCCCPLLRFSSGACLLLLSLLLWLPPVAPPHLLSPWRTRDVVVRAGPLTASSSSSSLSPRAPDHSLAFFQAALSRWRCCPWPCSVAGFPGLEIVSREPVLLLAARPPLRPPFMLSLPCNPLESLCG